MDNTIEHTLNALSLFQRPTQLFSNTSSPSTSQSNPNPSSKLNQLDPHQKKPTSNDQIKPITPIDSSPTAINHIITPNTTDNTCHTTKKITRRTPYNTRLTKKPLISIQDRPTLTNSTTSIFPYYNEKKKRSCPSDFLSPTRKALKLLLKMQNHQIQPHPIYFLLARASWRQNLLELCSKLLEKGNPKLVQLSLS
jgi:hypothetical protein